MVGLRPGRPVDRGRHRPRGAAHPVARSGLVPHRRYRRRAGTVRLVRRPGGALRAGGRPGRLPGGRLLVRPLLPEQPLPQRHGLGEVHRVRQVPLARPHGVRHAVPERGLRPGRARGGALDGAPGADGLVAHPPDRVGRVDLPLPAAVPPLERPDPALLLPGALPAGGARRGAGDPLARPGGGRPAASIGGAGLGRHRRARGGLRRGAGGARRLDAGPAGRLDGGRCRRPGRIHLPVARHQVPEAEHLGGLGPLQLPGHRGSGGLPGVPADHGHDGVGGP